MRKARVFYKNEEAGELRQLDNGSFEFLYLDSWLSNNAKPAISLTLPKKKETYKGEHLFPFFFNMLPEGNNRDSVCFQMRIDKSDNFGLLLNTAGNDTIGAVRVEKINKK